jgi:hypothetical protein
MFAVRRPVVDLSLEEAPASFDVCFVRLNKAASLPGFDDSSSSSGTRTPCSEAVKFLSGPEKFARHNELEWRGHCQF